MKSTFKSRISSRFFFLFRHRGNDKHSLVQYSHHDNKKMAATKGNVLSLYFNYDIYVVVNILLPYMQGLFLIIIGSIITGIFTNELAQKSLNLRFCFKKIAHCTAGLYKKTLVIIPKISCIQYRKQFRT